MRRFLKRFAYSQYWKEQKSRRSIVWRVLRILHRAYYPHFSWLEFELTKRWYYTRFWLGKRTIRIKYGKIACWYKAISPRNLWYLSIKNSDEGMFMPRLFDKYIGPGDICLDIGANTGMYTVPLAIRIGEEGHVFAFEPEPQSRDALLYNISLNNLNNAQVLDVAVGDKDGTTLFYIRPDSDTHSINEATHKAIPKGQFSIPVRISRIDALIKNKEILSPDFIKIDVEGTELEVIEGLGNIATVRVMLVEIHEDTLRFRGIVNPHSTLIAKLREKGFDEFEDVDAYHLLALRKE